jgi:hypothetical protein
MMFQFLISFTETFLSLQQEAHWTLPVAMLETTNRSLVQCLKLLVLAGKYRTIKYKTLPLANIQARTTEQNFEAICIWWLISHAPLMLKWSWSWIIVILLYFWWQYDSSLFILNSHISFVSHEFACLQVT